jgi:hypothetical protein
MSATLRLLQAASKIAGGDRALAQYLGIHEPLLLKLLENPATFPDALLLRVIDLILADREALPVSDTIEKSALPPRSRTPVDH